MSASSRRDRVLIYAPTSGDATAYALVDSGASDAAWYMGYTVTGSADQPIAGRQVALRRAQFEASDRLPVTDASVLRPLRDGTLYRVTGSQPTPRHGEVLLNAQSTGGDAVNITTDAPRFTVVDVQVEPSAVDAGVGAKIAFRAVAFSATGDVLTDRTPTWASSDNTVCLVTASSSIGDCLKPGTATVTATVSGVEGTATVVVS